MVDNGKTNFIIAWSAAVTCIQLSSPVVLAQGINFPLVGDFEPVNPRNEIQFRSPKSSDAVWHYIQAVEFDRQGDLHKALAEYKAALDIDKDFSQAWSSLGRMYASRKLNAKAIEAYNQALATNRLSPLGRMKILRSLAGLYVVQGSYEEAEPFYKEAINMNPSFYPVGYYADGLNSYAELLRKMEREKEAEDLEARACEIRAHLTAK